MVKSNTMVSSGTIARKLKRFVIVLDNDSLLYFPGSFLTGKVLLEIEEDTPAIGLYFHIIGEGVVNIQQTVTVTDKENYIDFRMRLLGDLPHATRSEAGSMYNGSTYRGDGASTYGGSPGRILILSPGVHSFPFKLGLPLGLPSTFLGKHGWVQYYCRALLREPGGIVHKNQQVFIIMNPIDLNLEPPILQQPFHCEIEEKIGSTCGSKGFIYARVRLDRGAFVPGESIAIYALIENDSKSTIKSTRATLVETIQYTAKGRYIETETRELGMLERGKVGSRGVDEWRNELLYIPPLPPTNLRGCHLIKINYDVYFIIKPKSGKEIKLQLPVMIATYPIRNPDGTLKRRKGAYYPSSLPVFRP